MFMWQIMAGINEEKMWSDRLGNYGEVIQAAENCDMLNTLDELIPLQDTGDRYCDFTDWLNRGKGLGLITSREYSEARNIIGRWI
jgi:hypothetical protein